MLTKKFMWRALAGFIAVLGAASAGAQLLPMVKWYLWCGVVVVVSVRPIARG